jgi:hypothetical protein
MIQEDVDKKYNLYAAAGFVSGLLWGSRVTTKVFETVIFGFAGLGIGGCLAYGELSYRGVYAS